MAKKEKKFNFKDLLTINNIIIVALLVIIVVMIITDKTVEVKKEKESFKINLAPETDYTYCQRLYHYQDSDIFSILSCDGDVYISKNNGDNVKLEIKDVAYLYNFLTINDNLIYFLTKSGEVYHLSVDNLLSEKYTLEKLDLKEITSITEFYIGKEKEDAYSSKIYGIDKNGKFHLIKSGN